MIAPKVTFASWPNYAVTRGDDESLAFTITDNSSPADLTGCQVWFTAKWDTADPDSAAVIALTGAVMAIAGATNASPIVVTLAAALLDMLVTGNTVIVSSVLGNLAANGTFPTVTVIDPTHVSLDGSTGSGSYTSGGRLYVARGIILAEQGANPGQGTLAIPAIATQWIQYETRLPFDMQVKDSGGKIHTLTDPKLKVKVEMDVTRASS